MTDADSSFDDQPPSMKRRLLRMFVWLAIVFILLVLVSGSGFDFILVTPYLLLFGWISFFQDVVGSAEVNSKMIVEAAVVTTILAVGVHYFGRWLYRELFPKASMAWKVRWTACGLGLVFLLFVAGIGTIGLIHQTAWLFMRTDPILVDSFSIRSKVSECINAAAVAKLAVEESFESNPSAGIPTNNEAAGYTPFTSEICESIQIDEQGILIDVNHLEIGADTHIRLRLTPVSQSPGKVNWSCEAIVGSNYAPASCHK